MSQNQKQPASNPQSAAAIPKQSKKESTSHYSRSSSSRQSHRGKKSSHQKMPQGKREDPSEQETPPIQAPEPPISWADLDKFRKDVFDSPNICLASEEAKQRHDSCSAQLRGYDPMSSQYSNRDLTISDALRQGKINPSLNSNFLLSALPSTASPTRNDSLLKDFGIKIPSEPPASSPPQPQDKKTPDLLMSELRQLMKSPLDLLDQSIQDNLEHAQQYIVGTDLTLLQIYKTAVHKMKDCESTLRGQIVKASKREPIGLYHCLETINQVIGAKQERRAEDLLKNLTLVHDDLLLRIKTQDDQLAANEHAIEHATALFNKSATRFSELLTVLDDQQLQRTAPQANKITVLQSPGSSVSAASSFSGRTREADFTPGFVYQSKVLHVYVYDEDRVEVIPTHKDYVALKGLSKITTKIGPLKILLQRDHASINYSLLEDNGLYNQLTVEDKAEKAKAFNAWLTRLPVGSHTWTVTKINMGSMPSLPLHSRS